MIPDGLVTYSAAEIETLAEQDLRRRPDIDPSAPINLELLIERLPNVDLEPRDGLAAEFQCEGCICGLENDKSRTIVLVDKAIYRGPWANYNVVLGEEYAHLKIHPSLSLYVSTPQDFIELQNDTKWEYFERDARRYSLAIRMPVKLVRVEVERAYARVVDEHGFGDAARIEAYIRNELAQRFRVPLVDAKRRLSTTPCDIRDSLLNSIQSRSLELLREDWTVRAVAPVQQSLQFD